MWCLSFQLHVSGTVATIDLLAGVGVLGGSSSLFRIAPCSFVALVEFERMCFRYNWMDWFLTIGTQSRSHLLHSKLYLDHVLLFVNLEEGRFPILGPIVADSHLYFAFESLISVGKPWQKHSKATCTNTTPIHSIVLGNSHLMCIYSN